MTSAAHAAEPVVMEAPELKADAKLQRAVSFEALRRPLREVLADLARQSEVTLAVAPHATLEAAQVTARVRELPLATVMAAFARLYGTSWSLADGVYRLEASTHSAIELKVLQTGDSRFIDTSMHRQRDWKTELLPHLDRARLQAKGGIPVTELPAEVGGRLRAALDAGRAAHIVEKEARLMHENFTDNIVRFAMPPPGGNADAVPQVTLRDAHGNSPASVTILYSDM